MPVIQISKIQLRRGPQTELPGAPTSMSPLIFAPGLDSGELGFATDTGRLFLGHEPLVGHANYRRPTFPYQNVEVLTENSVQTVKNMVGRQLRDLGDEAFTAVTLATTGDAFQTVADPLDPDQPFRVPFVGGAALLIEYGVYAADGKPVRLGHMRVVHDDNVAEPQVSDEAIADRRFATATDGVYDPNVAFNHIDLRVSALGPSGARYLVLEYMNNTASDTFTLRFRITRPRV